MLLETQRAQEDNRLNVKAALPSLPTPSLIMLLLLLLDCCGQICQPGDPEEEAGALSPRVSIRSITSMTEVKNAMFSTPSWLRARPDPSVTTIAVLAGARTHVRPSLQVSDC